MSDEDDIGNNVPLEKTKTIKEKSPEKTVEPKVTAVLPKKPRTEKQKTQFQQVMTKRQENIEKKKLEKKLEASKLLAEKDPEFFKQLHNKKEVEIVDVPSPVFEEEVKPKVKSTKKTPTIIELDTDEESEESVIIVKKKSKPKKKKKIIVEESEESTSGSDEDVVQLPKPKRNFVSQQNRKSVIKIHEKPNVSFEHYFV